MHLDNKISRNFISLLHSISCFTFNYNLINYSKNDKLIENMMIVNTYSYFICDIVYIILNRNWTDKLYIYHHMICIYMLHVLMNGDNIYEIYYLLYIGELSNLFNYIVYYMIKKQYSSLYTNSTRVVQVCWFSYFRIYILTNTLFTYYNKFNNIVLLYNLIILYGMGLIWGYKQFYNLSTDLYNLKYIK